MTSQAVVLFHLPRANPDYDERLIRRILDALCSQFHVRIGRTSRHQAPDKARGMADLAGDEVLFLASTQLVSIPAPVVSAFRWACHKRHKADWQATQQQVLCDIRGGDESRVRKNQRRRQTRRR